MLQEWKEQLRLLASAPDSQFHLNIRERVGKKATAILEKKLKELIFLMPNLVSRTYAYWAKQKSSSKVKKMAGFLLVYLYHPKDFLPEECGLFGYLDDAYLAALVYERVLKEASSDLEGLTVIDQGFLERVESLKHSAKMVIPKEAQAIDRMVEEILEGSQREFVGLFT